MAYPKGQPFSRRDPSQPVCNKCRRGYGSRHDGLCSGCRGASAWQAYRNDPPAGPWATRSPPVMDDPTPDPDKRDLVPEHVALLYEAYDFGQFADDFNHPLVPSVRAALRKLLDDMHPHVYGARR